MLLPDLENLENLEWPRIWNGDLENLEFTWLPWMTSKNIFSHIFSDSSKFQNFICHPFRALPYFNSDFMDVWDILPSLNLQNRYLAP